MGAKEILGWDIGGAHLKVARVDSAGRVIKVEQHPTPLWLGLGALDAVLQGLRPRFAAIAAGHAVTMTGELVDVFPTRSDGVRSLLELFASHFDPQATLVYGMAGEFLPLEQARSCSYDVASANWHATARFVAGPVGEGILLDVGSTTTDIIPFRNHQPCHIGSSDQQRLRSGELVYTGIVRTPVMAIVQRVPFAGEWQNVAAEYFATMADVYRITGELNEAHDQMAAADNAGKSAADSVRRLARMLGTDVESEHVGGSWRVLAEYIAERQLAMIDESFRRVVSRLGKEATLAIVGAGSGRFLARKLAHRHHFTYLDFEALLEHGNDDGAELAVSATAIAVAQLARAGMCR